MRTSRSVLSSCLGAILALASSLLATPAARAQGDSLIAWAVDGLAFGPLLAADVTLFSASDSARACHADCSLVTPLHLPSGAVVERLELDACDTDRPGRSPCGYRGGGLGS